MSSLESNLPSADESRAPPRAMIKPLLILVVAVAVVLGGIYGWQRFVATKFIGPMMKAMATAPQTVSTMTAVKSSWQSRSEAQGTVRAVRGADLSAQASGVVDTLHIESGAEVRAGTVLLTLKPNDDPAKLAQLQAQAEIDAVTLKRDQEQLAAQAVSQATVDVDAANLKSARAQVAAQQALIEEKTVRAPFAGKLGLRQVDEGQYLAAGTTIVTLQALDPIFIDFYVPQQALARLKVNESVTAVIEVKLTPERDGGFNKLAERISKFPEVQSCYLMSGGYDLMVVVEGRTLHEVAGFVSEKLSTQKGVISTATHFRLRAYKENGVELKKENGPERLSVAP